MAHPVPPPGTSGVVAGVTVVIPVRDRSELLDQCLTSLGRDTPVLVVDDGSRDLGPVAEVCRRHGARLLVRTVNGGPAAARSMLGQPVSYDRVPYFFSDQYDLGMETSGLPEPGHYDQVVYRGEPATLEFIAFWLSAGTVVAGMNVNVWDVTGDIQALIRAGYAGVQVDPARLADPGVPLAEMLG